MNAKTGTANPAAPRPSRRGPELRVPARILAATAPALVDQVPLPHFPGPGRTPEPSIEPQRDGSIPIQQFPGGPDLTSVSSRGETVHNPQILSENHRHLFAGYGEFVERIRDLQPGHAIRGVAAGWTDRRLMRPTSRATIGKRDAFGPRNQFQRNEACSFRSPTQQPSPWRLNSLAIHPGYFTGMRSNEPASGAAREFPSH